MDDHLKHQHAAVWAAIDEIARRREISASRLSIQIGGDSTAFNPSKRTKNGEFRWPSIETIARILILHQMTFAEFGLLIDNHMGRKN